MYKNHLSFFLALTCLCFFKNIQAQSDEYTTIVEGFDWGPAITKVIIKNDAPTKNVNTNDYVVEVERSHDCADIPPIMAKGKREIVYAYPSDAKGKKMDESTYVTLVLYSAPNAPLSSPMQYAFKQGCMGNSWVDYKMTIKHVTTDKTWTTEKSRLQPSIEKYDLKGKYEYESEKYFSYAHYSPKRKSGKAPLIIWLHGGGEGGTDPSIALLANKAYNYASNDIQKHFGGAYVLVPQCPGAWMHDKSNVMQPGSGEDIYNVGLMKFIKDFVKSHPDIDSKKIYVGGCSNGGYMSLKLLLKEPTYFAAAYISALAYQSQYISDEKIKSIKNVPIWFMHSKDDVVTDPTTTVVPVYERLKKVGAKNVHFSYYDHVTDLSGLYGGDDFHYNGHFSWIYSHVNECHKEMDGTEVMINGKPVTIMEWMAAQKSK